MNKSTTLVLLSLFVMSILSGQDCEIGISKDSMNFDKTKIVASTSTQVDIFNGKNVIYVWPWIGGKDSQLNGRSAISAYPSKHRTDFFPGSPIIDGSVDFGYCAFWDRVFKVSKSEIDEFINQYNQGNITIEDIPQSILYWPGSSNTYLDSNLIIPYNHAPFVDVDNDNLYNPMKGDYPDIRGADESLFWMVNDFGNIHTLSHSLKVFYNITTSAYIYKSKDNPLINNSVFFTSNYYPQSSKSFIDLIFALYIDFDSQDINHDKFGSIPEKNAVYMFNQFDFFNDDSSVKKDSSITLVKLLDYPEKDDNPIGLSSIINTGTQNHPTENISDLYLLYLKGLWADGTPLTYGHLGYNKNSTDTAKYIFDDIQDSTKWSICDDSVFVGDYRILMNLKPQYIEPGKITNISYVVTFLDKMDYPCYDIDSLNNALQYLQNFYDDNKSKTSNTISISKSKYNYYPNPTRGIVNIEGKLINSIKVYNAMGEEVFAKPKYLSNNMVQIDFSNNLPGMYYCRIVNEKNKISVIKIIVSR